MTKLQAPGCTAPQKTTCHSSRVGSPGGGEIIADENLAYLKKVVEAMKAKGASDEEIKSFQTKVQGYFTKVIKPNFKDYDFYVGESMDTDGM